MSDLSERTAQQFEWKTAIALGIAKKALKELEAAIIKMREALEQIESALEAKQKIDRRSKF